MDRITSLPLPAYLLQNLQNQGVNQQKIGQIFNISQPQVSLCLKGKRTLKMTPELLNKLGDDAQKETWLAVGIETLLRSKPSKLCGELSLEFVEEHLEDIKEVFVRRLKIAWSIAPRSDLDFFADCDLS